MDKSVVTIRFLYPRNGCGEADYKPYSNTTPKGATPRPVKGKSEGCFTGNLLLCMAGKKKH